MLRTLTAIICCSALLALSFGCESKPPEKPPEPPDEKAQPMEPGDEMDEPQPSTDKDIDRPAKTQPGGDEEQVCNMLPCHGLGGLRCEAGPPIACTEIYQAGDFCRKFAQCEKAEDGCKLVTQEEFAACKACIESCDAGVSMDCDKRCRDKFK